MLNLEGKCRDKEYNNALRELFYALPPQARGNK
jgi:hypothetical protein